MCAETGKKRNLKELVKLELSLDCFFQREGRRIYSNLKMEGSDLVKQKIKVKGDVFNQSTSTAHANYVISDPCPIHLI